MVGPLPEPFYAVVRPLLFSVAAKRRPPMMDAGMIAITIVFFVLSWLYVVGCERL